MKFLINEFFNNVSSQNGEDGINKKLLEFLDIKEGILLEIGASDGFWFSNTANLWKNNIDFKSILIECSAKLHKESLEKQYKNIECFPNECASLDNPLEKIIEKSRFTVTNDNFILASIDIDGDDLNVARSLHKYKPKILIIEPNGNIKEKTNKQGTTVLEYVTYFETENNGYTFLGMSGSPDHPYGNCYFIRNDLKNMFEITQDPWEKRGVVSSTNEIY